MFRITSLVGLMFICQALGAPSNIRCGYEKKANGLIFGGENVNRSQIPFIVALFDKTDGSGSFFCSGSIISYRHVITAAHCLHNKGESAARSADSIKVHLGRYDLDDDEEIFAVNKKDVSKIILHPDWDARLNANYGSDIAMLVCPPLANFSMTVQPICLPSTDTIADKGFLVS